MNKTDFVALYLYFIPGRNLRDGYHKTPADKTTQ